MSSSTNVIEEQLGKVRHADLSNFDKETNTYTIPKRTDIKIEEDKCYLVQLHRSFFNNQTVMLNWNSGSIPPGEFLSIDVLQSMNKMIKVSASTYNAHSEADFKPRFWNGWLSTDELTVIAKL